MSLLGNLFSKILGHKSSASGPASAAPTSASKPTATSGGAPSAKPTASSAAPAPAAAPASIPRMDDVDLEHLIDDLVKKSGQKLDWRHSIVDLMKAVGMDSSLSERKELAKELGYSGDMNDSAKMNVWLHSEVFKRIAANGGKVPAALQD